MLAGGFLVAHEFVPLVGCRIPDAGCRIDIFLGDAVIELMCGRWNRHAKIQIDRKPALAAELDCGIGFAITDINKIISAIENGIREFVDS